VVFRDFVAERDRKSGPAGVLAARFFDARDRAVFVEGDQTRADVDGRNLLNLAVVANGEFTGAAPDIDVQYHAADFFRVRHGTRAMRGHGRFQAVTRADGDEFAGLFSKQLCDGARVAPSYGDAGQNQCAGIDFFAADLGFFVLLV